MRKKSEFRILHIAEAAGGVERYLITLLDKMKAYPEFEHILVCSSGFNTDKFRGLVRSVCVIDEMRNAISPVHDGMAILQVRMAIRRYKPDIVYCHSSKAGGIGRIADIGIRNKIIYNPHGWAFNMKDCSRRKIRLYELVEKMLARLTDRIVCISEYEQMSALEHGISEKDRLIVINNGIDFDEYKDIKPKSREELGIPKDAFVVGTIGRLTPQKAPDVFVKMAKKVKEQVPHAFFVMVGDDIGDGEFRAKTEQQIKEAGLNNCFLITGWVDDPLDYARVFDVATLLSRWEGFGLALPEYMLMGKPIVASKADAIPYVLGNAGLLVDVDDYERAADHVVRLSDDQSIVRMLINEGSQRVGLFDCQRTAAEHAALLNVLTKKKTYGESDCIEEGSFINDYTQAN